MPIYLDDEPVQVNASDLGAALEEVRRQLEPRGRIVVEVQIGGESLGGDTLTAAHDRKVANEDVRLYSADPRQLAVDALTQVRERLEEARILQEQTADLLQQDEPVEALEKLGQVIQIWLQTQQAVLQTTVLVGIDLGELTVDGREVSDLTTQLIDKLTQLKELVAAGDTVALADVLGYEWPPVVEAWDHLAGEIISRCR